MKWRGRSGLLRLRVGRGTVRAEACRGGVVTWAGEAAYESLLDLTETIARLAAEPVERCGRLAVTLERPPVQTRTLTDLPRVKDRELVALVAHQAARYFRRNGHALVTDAVWAGKAQVAHAAAAPEPVVEAIVAGAHAAGLQIEGICPAGSPAPLLLLPGSERAARARAQQKLIRRLGVATAGVWMLVLGLAIGRLVWERRAVERQLTSLAAPIAAVLTARRELRDADALLQAVAQADRQRGRGLVALGAITTALPDSAVLTSLTWNADGSGVLTGAARRASLVLERFERTNALPAPRLEGAVVREAIAGREWERFTIVFGREQRAP